MPGSIALPVVPRSLPLLMSRRASVERARSSIDVVPVRAGARGMVLPFAAVSVSFTGVRGRLASADRPLF